MKINPGLKKLTVPIDSVRLDSRNARLHGAKNQRAITDSLRLFGQQKPIVVNPDGEIIAGNGTYQGALELGAKEIAVIVTDLDTHTAQRAYAIADNRTGELAEWDYEGLSAQFSELIEEGFDVEALGWTSGEIESLTLADWNPPPQSPLPTSDKDKEKKEGRHIVLTDEQWEMFNRAAAIVRSMYGEQLSDSQCVEMLCSFFAENNGDGPTESNE